MLQLVLLLRRIWYSLPITFFQHRLRLIGLFIAVFVFNAAGFSQGGVIRLSEQHKAAQPYPGDQAITGLESHSVTEPGGAVSMPLMLPEGDDVVGLTQYDLQSNYSSRGLLLAGPDSITAGWTMSLMTGPFSDRGTAINQNDGVGWGEVPSSRIEDVRTGWGDLGRLSDGREFVLAHGGTGGLVFTMRSGFGSEDWTTTTLPALLDADGNEITHLWPRAAVGGADGNTIHAICISQPEGNGGVLLNGQDGAMIYMRSTDGGANWDMQTFAELDTASFAGGFSPDSYAIDARGDQVAFAVFNRFSDSFVMTSVDNGDTWTYETMVDFPVDNYVVDSGALLDTSIADDFDEAGFPMFFNTDLSGDLVIDEEGTVHVFFGAMYYGDYDLTDGTSNWYPYTNGLEYWRSDMGSDSTQTIAYAYDIDGNGSLDFEDELGSYYVGICSQASACVIEGSQTIAVTYSALMENISNGILNFRHVYLVHSDDLGATWNSESACDLTPDEDGNLYENVFPHVPARSSGPVLPVLFQRDSEPGIYVRGDQDSIDVNDIIVLQVLTNGYTVEGLIPEDFATGVVTDPTTFSWMPTSLADTYNVYIWELGTPEPVNPTVQGHIGINLEYDNLERSTDYLWKVEAMNGCGLGAFSATQTFRTQGLSDVAIVEINVPSTPFSGEVAEISWGVENLGSAITDEAYRRDFVYLSADDVVDVSDVYLGQIVTNLSLAPGESSTEEKQVLIPQGYSGDFYIIVVVDYYNAYGESDTENNTLAQPISIQLTPPADLQVTNLVAFPIQINSGGELNVTWEVTNAGVGPTIDVFCHDRIYLSPDSIFDLSDAFEIGDTPNNGLFDAGESRTRTLECDVPEGIDGTYYIYVITDADETVYEFTNEDNNLSTPFEIDVTLTPPPDFTPTSLTIPGEASAREQITIQYSVENIGAPFSPVDPETGQSYLVDLDLNSSSWISWSSYSDQLSAMGDAMWYDRVYLSTDSVWDEEDVQLGNRFFDSRLKVSYSQYQTIADQLVCLSGDFDVPNFIQTCGLSSGLIQFSYSSCSYVGPDCPGVSYPVNTGWCDNGCNGLDFPMSWNPGSASPPPSIVVTRGEGNCYSPSQEWNFDNAGQSLLQARPDPCGYGIGYDASMNVTLPEDAEGEYYLIVKADADNSVFEYVYENNNILCSEPFIIKAPDLEVTSISLPDTVMSGAVMAMEYSVANVGEGELISRTRKDRARFAADPEAFEAEADENSVLNEKSAPYSEGFEVGETKEKSLVLGIPQGIEGVHYLEVMADATEVITEGGDVGVNTMVAPVYVELSPWVDLVPDTISVLTESVLMGEELTLEAVVRSDQPLEVSGQWVDRVLFSTSSEWSEEMDILTVDSKSIVEYLSQGDTYATTYSLPVPVIQEPTDIVYVYLQVDRNDQLYEYVGEANNILRSEPLQYVALPPVELDVAAAYMSGTSVTAGQDFIASWTVVNEGSNAVDWGIDNWYDGIYLSLDSEWDASDILLNEREILASNDSVESYSMTSVFDFPPGFSGFFHVLVVADHLGLTNDPELTNNVRVLTFGGENVIYVIPQSYPDLAVSGFAFPNYVVAGQPAQTSYTVTNVGEAPTTSPFTDRLYLSSDVFLDEEDMVLASFSQQPLEIGEARSRSEEFTLPSVIASGYYYVLLRADANGAFYEPFESDNGAAVVTQIEVLPPGDLQVKEVFVPDSGMAYDYADISWRVRNEGENPIIGQMKDGIFLSSDTVWDLNDPQLLVRPIGVALQPGEDYVVTDSVLLPGVSLGDYHVLVRTDLNNNFIESEESNNRGFSDVKLDVTVPSLELEIEEVFLLPDEQVRIYRLNVPEEFTGKTLSISVDPVEDEAWAATELYASLGEVPTRSDHDYAATNPQVRAQQILVPSTPSGDYYVLAYGNRASGSGSFTPDVALLGAILPFEVVSVDTDMGGNTGPCTVLIRGSEFSEGMSISLLSPTGEVRTATASWFIDATRLYATFDLTGAELGAHTLRLYKPVLEEEATFDGFTVVPGDPYNEFGADGDLFTCTISNEGSEQLLGSAYFYPPSTRPNRLVPMTIQWYYGGNIDTPVRTRFMASLGGAPLSFTVDGLDEDLQQLLLVFEESDGPPGLLRPGASGFIQIYSFSSDELRFIISD